MYQADKVSIYKDYNLNWVLLDILKARFRLMSGKITAISKLSISKLGLKIRSVSVIKLLSKLQVLVTLPA